MLRRKATTEHWTSSQGTGTLDESRILIVKEAEGDEKKKITKQDRLTSLLTRVAVCGSGCVICCIFILFITILFINEGHHVTCQLNGALCTPFREYVNRFPMLPMQRATNAVGTTSSPVVLSDACKRFEDFLSLHHHPNNNNNNNNKVSKQILFLLGESRGGSTYTYDTLNAHPEITMIGQEALFSFSNNICNNNEFLLRDVQNCTFENWLDALYTNSYDRAVGGVSSTSTSSSSSWVVGTKINIEQIPPEFYHDLASYLSCIRESAIILQVTRASTIASFLNYQAEPLERIQDLNFNIDSNNLPKGLETSLELDPDLAADWVHRRDGLSQDLFRVLAFESPLPLRFHRVYYEHLKDPTFGDDYWRSIFSFLGVDTSKSASILRAKNTNNGNLRTTTKTHGTKPCFQRIANWERVKQALGVDSLSSSVCERHS